MARPITKYAATVRQWERLPEMMRAAFRAAMTGRPGPAYLAIPDELLLEKIDADHLPPIHPATRYRVTNMGAGDPASIERAADLLANAKRIYLHAGKGVLWADGAQALQALPIGPAQEGLHSLGVAGEMMDFPVPFCARASVAERG